jgi:hypothetical protein
MSAAFNARACIGPLASKPTAGCAAGHRRWLLLWFNGKLLMQA